jgi:hypothetical protein
MTTNNKSIQKAYPVRQTKGKIQISVRRNQLAAGTI